MSENDDIYTQRVSEAPQNTPEETPISSTTGESFTSSSDDFFRDSLAIIGPMGSGKTALVVCLPQACRLRQRNEPALSIVTEKLPVTKVSVGPDPTHLLQVEDVSQMLRGGVNKICELDQNPNFVAGTEQPYIYPLNIRIENLKVDLKLRVIDGPGGGLFPSRAEDFKSQFYFDTLTRACAKARRLLLCVSSTRPDIDFVSRNLDAVLQGILFHSPNQEELPFERVLIMLTKVDRLALDLVMASQRDPRQKPQEMARLISPLEQVKEIVNIHVLEAIRSRLAKGARMAVSLSSAAGFDFESGNAMIGLDGRIIRLDGSGFQESGQSMLNRWRPFGVREAMYFLAGGEPRGPVLEYTEEDSYVYEDQYAVQMEAN